jgi:TetR/AcrR family transcriptional regulator, cholesterol catabolism regulator
MITEQQTKWLQQVEALYMRYGIKSTTMDDVARELGISKKTLYQFVENKDDLIVKVVQCHISQEKQLCEEQFNQSANAIEEIMMVIKFNTQQLAQMRSNIVYDLQRYHRDAWDIVAGYRNKFMYDVVHRNLQRGIDEGLYRIDIKVDIMTKIHIITSFQLFDEDFFPSTQYARAEIFNEYLMHYLYGIVSEQGRTYMSQKRA